MLKVYKSKGNWYYILDLEDVCTGYVSKLDGQAAYSHCEATLWDMTTSSWEPQELDYRYCTEELREVTWLELLVVTGQCERVALWEHEACFGVPSEDL